MKSLRLINLFLILAFSSHAQESHDNSVKEKRIVRATGGLRLRNTPSIKGAAVYLIPNGSVVEFLSEKALQESISGRTGKWTHIVFTPTWPPGSTQEGWVFGAFLIKDDIPSLLPRTVGTLDPFTGYYAFENFVVGKYPSPPGAQDYVSRIVFVREGSRLVEKDISVYYPAEDPIFLFLNNDGIPDMVEYGGCCGNSYVKIRIGGPGNSFTTIESFEGCETPGCSTVKIVSIGKCEATVIETDKKVYHFDCDLGKLK